MDSDVLNNNSVQKIDSVIEEFIQNKIKNNKALIFSRTYCGYSKMAKNLFHEVDYIYHAVELDKRKDGFAILKVLTKMTGNDHTPHVFVKGQYLGGGTNLRDLHDIDRLRYLLGIPQPSMYAPPHYEDYYEKDDIPGVITLKTPSGNIPLKMSSDSSDES